MNRKPIDNVTANMEKQSISFKTWGFLAVTNVTLSISEHAVPPTCHVSGESIPNGEIGRGY